MYKKLILLSSFVIVFLLISCSPKHSEIILSKYDDNAVTMGEFEKQYEKNAGSLEAAKKDSLSKYKNFLELYTNFKMKLRDAVVRGYGNDPELNKELLDYKKKVGVTFLLEKKIVDPGIRDLYNKRKWELRVSHIMIVPDSSGEEAAKKLAQSVLDSIKAGADFSEMAARYSKDRYSSKVGGDIYYFTAGQLPEEFESAAYSLQPGEMYPDLVRSKYGYHILKLTDKRERVPQVRASHILIGFKDANGKIDSAAARAKIDSILVKARSDSDFAKLAEEYSQDPGSAKKGGDLGVFQRRQMVKEFDEAVFDLKKVGDISNVIKTQFGYHIIKLTEKAPLPSFEEEKEELTNLFKKTRYQAAYDAMLDSLRSKYNYKLNQQTFDTVLKGSDTLKIGKVPSNFDDIKNLTLFSFADTGTSVGDFFSILNESSDFQNKFLKKDVFQNAVNKISGDLLLDHEALNLEKTDSTFADLMNDYRNGIYIFKLQEDEVWNKINVDSAKLYNYYLDTKDKYMWPDRVEYKEIFSRNDSLINHYYTLLKNGEEFDSLAMKYTERPGFKEKAGHYDLQDVKQSQLATEANKLQNAGDFSEPIKNAGGYSIVMLVKKDPSHPKTFEEAKPEVSGAFQEAESKRLENNYIESLKKLYEPVYYYDELPKAFTDQ